MDSLVAVEDILLKAQLMGKDLLHLFRKVQKKRNTKDEVFVAGITEDARIDSIPIINTEYYDVVFPHMIYLGEGDYSEVTRADSVYDLEVDITTAIKRYMEIKIAEEERKKPKPKLIVGSITLSVLGDFAKRFKSSEVKNYPGIDTNMINITSYYSGKGTLRFDSINSFNKTYKEVHKFTSELKTEYARSVEDVSVSKVKYWKSKDDVDLNSTYTWDVKETWVQPYFSILIDSELYNKKRYPMVVTYTIGLKRRITSLSKIFKSDWFKIYPLVFNYGPSLKRNYMNNINDIGGTITISEFRIEALKGWVELKTTLFQFDHSPTAKSHNKIFCQNKNVLTIRLSKITKKVDFVINNTNYVHRDTSHRKIAYTNELDMSLSYNLLENKDISF